MTDTVQLDASLLADVHNCFKIEVRLENTSIPFTLLMVSCFAFLVGGKARITGTWRQGSYHLAESLEAVMCVG